MCKEIDCFACFIVCSNINTAIVWIIDKYDHIR